MDADRSMKSHLTEASVYELQDQVRYWRDVACYLADCHAATAEIEGNMARTSKSSRRRFAAICRTAADALHGNFIKKAGPPEDVAERCDMAAKDCDA